jgi:glycosyltransferase 2 family protein
LSLFHWLILFFFSIIYAISGIFLAFAWKDILNFLKTEVDKLQAIKIYGLSQLAKYVPGNIFHLAGRQALGMASDLPAINLAKSTVWELGLMVFSGLFFGLLTIPLLLPSLSIHTSIIIFLLLFMIVVICMSKWLSKFISRAFVFQTIFLLLTGVIFTSILYIINPDVISISTFSVFIGAYIIAWLAGLITPGAPAGLGIRELVLLFLLKGLVPELDLLLAVLVSRVVTVLGDLLYFTVSLFIKLDKKYELGN